MSSNLKQDLEVFSNSLDGALVAINYTDKHEKLIKLQAMSSAANFWQDASNASQHMQTQTKLSTELEPWTTLQNNLSELRELVDLNDISIETEITNQLAELEATFTELKKQLRFSGPYDQMDALMSIHAGAGGTDAQDWAQMLLRMYSRWAENNGVKAIILDESAGEEAGIKSVQLELSGSHIYGKLRSEHGVHRLVRLSPFNADAKRQTSFAKVEVLPKIEAPDEVPIDEADLKIDVFRSGGKGGQSVNTTDSAVRVTHLPTGIVVSIQNERSQIQNKETALTILRSKLAQLKEEQHLETMADIKGPNQSAEWGNQIRSYVLHPYTMVKDLRTRYETTNVQAVLDGDLNPVIDSYLETNINS